jgi:queuine tRNA-ribosyltransferase
LSFQISNKDKDTKARAGVLNTGHGAIETPVFMPVGTAGTVKAIHQNELKADVKAQIILGNTYHLYLRPGLEIIEKAYGLHKFIGWDKPILTDSGG